MFNKILVIYGPTASGKTALGIDLAKKNDGELISADSRQIYRNLDITTGKISFKSKVEKHKGYWIVDGVKIHGFDLANPGQSFSVADFLKFAHSSMIQIIELKKLPIIVGGTGFYIKALINGIESLGIPANPELRRELECLSVDQLYQRLLVTNPKRAKAMNESDRKNPRRLIRAIEITLSPDFLVCHSGVVTTTIESGSYRSVSLRSRMTNYFIIGLTAPNTYLYSHADQWLNERLEYGMIDEVKNILDQKINSEWLDNLGLECRWISRYLSGKTSRQEAINRLRGDIHSFIRRQKTWFKKFDNLILFDISKPDWQKKLEKMINL